MRRKVEDIDVQAAALLFSQGNRQEDIAASLSLSQSVVSRLLAQARESGLLETTVKLARDKIADLETVKARVAHRKLTEKLQNAFDSNPVTKNICVRVFLTPYRAATSDIMNRRREEFGSAAAGYIRDLLLESKVCGVSWGWTVGSLIKGMEKNHIASLRKKHPIRFLPLCGEPLSGVVPMVSSSSIAAQLDTVINGGTGQVPSLALVPTFIPVTFQKKREVDLIWKFIRQVEAYQNIFGSKDPQRKSEPWIDRIDTILTSVGHADKSLLIGDRDLVATVGIKRKDLTELVIGDICGVFLPKQELTEEQLGQLDDLKRRWTGITEEQLALWAKAAQERKIPGVIVMAIGREKAEIIYAGLKRGLINHLAIDQDLAEALERLIDRGQGYSRNGRHSVFD